MSYETVVRDEVTRMGQHWLEVLRVGAPVDGGRWWERVPNEAYHLARGYRYHEKALDLHRLYIRWPAREVVRLMDAQAVELGEATAAMWFVEPGQSLRAAVQQAALCLWLGTGRVARAAATRRLPDGAPDVVELEDGPVRLGCAVWIPARYVVVV